MLQKGFLKPKEDLENIRTIKRSRMFFVGGVVVMILALIWMMMLLRTDESESLLASRLFSVKIAGVAVIAGIVLALVGWWMNFFAQNKKRKTGV